MYIKNNNGPKILIFGSPDKIFFIVDEKEL